MFRGHQKQFNPKAVLNNLMLAFFKSFKKKNWKINMWERPEDRNHIGSVLFVHEEQMVAKLIQQNRMVGKSFN